MKVEVVEISKKIIKPSSPTPDSLRKYQLSFLDQLAPTLFMPLIFFYPANRKFSNEERLNRLKSSLSEALTRFYPLAGRMVDPLYFDCNDEGVDFVEAKANVELSEILSNPIPSEMNKFLPYDLDEFKDFCMAVQVSFLSCGAMAIGLMFSHKMGDAMSFQFFAGCWASIARGDAIIPNPKYKAATIFPPRNHVDEFKLVTKDIVTKIFVFPASKIDELKDRYAENKQRPTRIEALSAFIWSRFVASTVTGRAKGKMYGAIDTQINLRPRFDPPLSQDYFGNIFRPATALITLNKEYDCPKDVLDKIREAKSNVNGEYLAKFKEGHTPEMDIKDYLLVRLVFTSLCRFPLNEVDFGWGGPIRVASASFGIKNVVSFLDANAGNGVEAWVNLTMEDMAKFEADMELRAYLSPTM